MGAGIKIKEYITDHDIKQRQLAAAVGVTPASMSHYLREQSEIPSRILSQIATHLGLTTDYLLGLTDSSARPMALAPRERTLVEDFRTLSPAQQELIEQNVRLMQAQNRR